MGKLFSVFKRGAFFVVMVALLFGLCACGGGSGGNNAGNNGNDGGANANAGDAADTGTGDEAEPADPSVAAYTVRNDRLGMEVSFRLPGAAADWEESEFDYNHMMYLPQGEDLDATNSWMVVVSPSIAPLHYKEVLVDGEEPSEEYETIITADNGMKWLKNSNTESHNYSYATIFDEYLDGYRALVVSVSTNGYLEDGQEPDTSLIAGIEESLLNSVTYTTEYEGKPDYSDAAYLESHTVKWPHEIPFENGVIHAEEYTEGYTVYVKFRYEDAGTTYHVEIFNDFIHEMEDSDNVPYMEWQYFGEDAMQKDEPYEEIELGGYPAALLFKGSEYEDLLYIACDEGGADAYPVLESFILIESDGEAYSEANKQKLIDMMSAAMDAAEILDLDVE